MHMPEPERGTASVSACLNSNGSGFAPTCRESTEAFQQLAALRSHHLSGVPSACFFKPPSSTCTLETAVPEAALAEKVSELESEVERLQQQLDQERGVSRVLKTALESRATRAEMVPERPRAGWAQVEVAHRILAEAAESAEPAIQKAKHVLDDVLQDQRVVSCAQGSSPLGEPDAAESLAPAPRQPQSAPLVTPTLPSDRSNPCHPGRSGPLSLAPLHEEPPGRDKVEAAAVAAFQRLRSENDSGAAAIAERIVTAMRNSGTRGGRQ